MCLGSREASGQHLYNVWHSEMRQWAKTGHTKGCFIVTRGNFCASYIADGA
jgi:hypothetical protein